MRRILVLIAVYCFVLSADAQPLRSYGIKAGAVLAGQHWRYSSFFPPPGVTIADQMRWGLDVGLFLEWLDNPTFTLITEFHYLQRGFREELPGSSAASPELMGTTVLSPRLDYLSIPLLMKFRIDFPPFSPYVLAGPRYDILMNTNPDNFEAVLDDIKGYDWGMTLGIGIVYDVSPEYDIGAEFQYDLSFQDIYNTEILTVRNHSMQFLLFAAF